MLYEITNSSVELFMTAPSHSEAQMTAELKYITDHLTQSAIPYTLSITSEPSYFNHFVRYCSPLPNGIYDVSHSSAVA